MTERVKDYRDLKVWQRAMDLVPMTYRLARSLPKHEQFSLADQIRRSVVSVPANIAEGQARKHTREFLQHLSIARGSLAELHTLMLVAERLQYLTHEELATLEQAIIDVRMPLSGLIKSLQESA
ncbi:MAG: four helix bundle protein [Acidobacteria bacterium]|nr:MAG: four helix bundle protein [Acidobacteriota bacterium]